MDEVEILTRTSGDFDTLAQLEHRDCVVEKVYDRLAKGGIAGLETVAGRRAGDGVLDLEEMRGAVQGALEEGEAGEARRLMEDAEAAFGAEAKTGDWGKFRDLSSWPDGWLVAAIRKDPPDEEALDALVDRHWKALFGRCQMMTLNQHKASDLAQDAWHRVLRARRSLKPDGNFPAYLMTVATNLWRDLLRSAKRAGPMAEQRLISINAEISSEDGQGGVLADVLPDVSSLQVFEQSLLKVDIDEALKRLTPLLHEVLVARFVVGESCAEIGRRYGRTEQTVSSWVREASRQMREHLESTGWDANGRK